MRAVSSYLSLHHEAPPRPCSACAGRPVFSPAPPEWSSWSSPGSAADASCWSPQTRPSGSGTTKSSQTSKSIRLRFFTGNCHHINTCKWIAQIERGWIGTYIFWHITAHRGLGAWQLGVLSWKWWRFWHGLTERLVVCTGLKAERQYHIHRLLKLFLLTTTKKVTVLSFSVSLWFLVYKILFSYNCIQCITL